MKFNRITLGLFVFGISASFMLASAQLGKSTNNDSAPSSTTTTTTARTTSTDSISALSSTSITIGQLTCAINSGSPSLAGFAIGERVGAACTDGALVTIVPLPPLGGPIKATIDSITSAAIGYDGFSCLLGPSSPSLAAFSVHEPVYLTCVNGYLTTIVPRTSPDGTTTTTTTTTPTPTPGSPTGLASKLALRLGAIQLLSASSITVGSLTCTVDATSPSLTGFNTGDRVGIVCVDGVLGLIVPLAGEPTNTTRRAATFKHELLLRYSACAKHAGRNGCRKATVRLKHANR